MKKTKPDSKPNFKIPPKLFPRITDKVNRKL